MSSSSRYINPPIQRWKILRARSVGNYLLYEKREIIRQRGLHLQPSSKHSNNILPVFEKSTLTLSENLFFEEIHERNWTSQPMLRKISNSPQEILQCCLLEAALYRK